MPFVTLNSFNINYRCLAILNLKKNKMKKMSKYNLLNLFNLFTILILSSCSKNSTPTPEADLNNISFISISMSRDLIGNVNSVGIKGTSNGVSIDISGLKSNDPSDKDSVSITNNNLITTSSNASISPLSNSAVVFTNINSSKISIRVGGKIYSGSLASSAFFAFEAATVSEANSWINSGKATLPAVTAGTDRITKANQNRYTLSVR